MKKHTDSSTRYRSDQAKNLVSFLVGDVRYAVDIHRVREIVNPLPFVHLPHAPDEVVGVADHRGEVLPIVDLRVRFGLKEAEITRRTKWIIVRIVGEAHAVALVVDAVTDVFGAAPHDQRGVPELAHGRDLRGISNVYSHEGRLVFVVDPEVVAQAAQHVDAAHISSLLSGGS